MAYVKVVLTANVQIILVDKRVIRQYRASSGIFYRHNTEIYFIAYQPADKIIEEVLKEYSKVVSFKLNTKGKFAEREYCVQFEETDFAFVSRLVAEEGISYYFTHKDGEHELIFVCSNVPKLGSYLNITAQTF